MFITDWRTIPGFSKYKINMWGNVMRASEIPKGFDGKVIKVIDRGPSSPAVTLLSDGGKRRSKAIAELVLETFVGPKTHKVCGVNFQDKNNKNYSLNNISWKMED